MIRATKKPNYRLLGTMGDVHGDTDWTVYAIDQFAGIGITHILQLGDFKVGSRPKDRVHLHETNAALKARGMVMVVTLGNHEDYLLLEGQLEDSRYLQGFQQLPEYEHLLFARRGQRWNWDGVDYCSLGGANSINYQSLTPSISWWPEESITLGDVYNARAGGVADIMLTHDCPEGVPILSKLTPAAQSMYWTPEALAYAKESRLMLRQAVDGVQPQLLLHGHYHVFADLQTELSVDGTEDSYTMRSICLDRERTRGNIGVLRPQSRKFLKFHDFLALAGSSNADPFERFGS